MNGSAAQSEESAEQGIYRATGTDSASAFEAGMLFDSGAAALKQIAAERLAAHRNRRAVEAATEAEREARARARAEALRRESSHGASRVREAVAARYQQSVSYREYLAAEAQRALEQAEAEAEVARRKAHAVAEAQMQLLEEMERWSDAPAEPSPRDRALSEQRTASRIELADALTDLALGARELISETGESSSGGPAGAPYFDAPSIRDRPSPALVQTASAGLKVRLHEQLGGPISLASRSHAPGETVTHPHYGEMTAEELDHLEQEIEFRRDPEFRDHNFETQAIQANVIEFPRQLIAARKARPRLAEGPLREDAAPRPQLSIFEVEPEQISFVPEDVAEFSGAPEWQGMLLDAAIPPSLPAERDLDARPQAAPLQRRLMALFVDGCCVGCGMVAFVALLAEIAGPALHGFALPALGASAAAALLIFALLYQGLFFSLADATPGMRFARISLCTFNDENPSRSAMRIRIVALLLAVCPLGLGLVWMALDDDGLGWHDRISRMYPRAY